MPLFAVQALSALSDNVLKNGLVFLVLSRFAGAGSEALVSLAGAAFVVPFLLLSALGGELADGGDKAALIRRLKLVEVGVAALAAAGFALGSVPSLMAALLGFGALAALFGPVKYAVLPDHLPAADVPTANAAIEGSTFLAILAGAAVGAAFGGAGGPGALALSALVAGSSALAALAATYVPATAASDPGRRADPNVLRSTVRALTDLRAPGLLACAVATSLFWLVGAVAMALLPVLVTRVLGGADVLVVAHLAAFAAALAAGSFAAAWLAGGRALLLPSVVGAVLLAAAVLDAGVAVLHVGPSHGVASNLLAYLRHPGALRVALDLTAMAFAGGLVVVPAFSTLQVRAEPARRARVVAASGVLNAAFMILGALGAAALQRSGVGAAGVLLATAAVAAALAAWLAWALPVG